MLKIWLSNAESCPDVIIIAASDKSGLTMIMIIITTKKNEIK